MGATRRIAALGLILAVLASRKAAAQSDGAIPVSATIVASPSPALIQREVVTLARNWFRHPQQNRTRTTQLSNLAVLPINPRPETPRALIRVDYLRN
jgi:hypothetical protein